VTTGGQGVQQTARTGSPLPITEAVAPKLSPFPDVSIFTASIDREPSSVLTIFTSADLFAETGVRGWSTHSKFVMLTTNSPSAEAATGVEVSRLSAMFILPQGELVEGFWTSFNVGFPSTPRAGAIAAWALTEDVKARRNMGAMNDLDNILTNEIRARGIRGVKAEK
jgi:hypothetical protein